MAAQSLWDDPAVKPAGTDFVSFKEIGDGYKGVVSGLSKHTWADGSVCAKIEFAEEDAPTLTAGQTVLAQQLFVLRPLIGETLDVKMVGVQQRPGGKTLKQFHTVVTAKDGTVREEGSPF